MNIVFRTDASLVIGSGHVMRCLTLADAMQSVADMVFVCRNFQGHLKKIIEQRGYTVVLLPEAQKDYEIREGDLEHAEWLGVDWLIDANETKAKIAERRVDWLIVDHYGIDYQWHRKLRSSVNSIFVIDDLADRKLNCDLLLDQTYGRSHNDYLPLVNKDCHLLIGADYALLRPEFANFRDRAQEKRNLFSGIKKILVTMGGSDPDNVTEIVLEGLSKIEWHEPPVVDVVMGGSAPHIEAIKKIAKNHKLKVIVSSNVSNMAERIYLADLAIGAGGSTSWERCCLGLPALTTLNAANQTEIIKQLEYFGAIVALGYFRELTPQVVSDALNQLNENNKLMVQLSRRAFEVADGKGVERVTELLNVP